MRWTNGAYEESWTFTGTTLSEVPTSIALPTSHHFHRSLSPVISLSMGILREWQYTTTDQQRQSTEGSYRRC